MSRKDITHENLLIVDKASRATLLAGVERGDPGPLRNTPTAHRTDVSLGSVVSEKAIEWFRKWAVEGDTATLRTNSLSVIAKLPGKENADLVIQVLENDPKVRRLIVASEISRLTQLDWKTALRRRRPDDDPRAAEARAEAGQGRDQPEGHRVALGVHLPPHANGPGPRAIAVRSAGDRSSSSCYTPRCTYVTAFGCVVTSVTTTPLTTDQRNDDDDQAAAEDRRPAHRPRAVRAAAASR